MPTLLTDVLLYVLAAASLVGIYGSLAALSADLAPFLGKEDKGDRMLFAAKVVGLLILAHLLIGATSPVVFRILGAELGLWTFLMLGGLLELAIISVVISIILKSARGEGRVRVSELMGSAATVAAALAVTSLAWSLFTIILTNR